MCFDEFGPLELRPIHGHTWTTQTRAHRLPATYTRLKGVRHLLAFFDVGKDKLWGYFTRRKRGPEVLQALKRMRRHYPITERIYLILDNFSPHKRSEVRLWARKNNVSLVWTPTNASWLNRIECQFTELKRFALDHSNYKEHSQMQIAIKKFLKYRNARNKKRKHNLTNLKRH